MQREAQVEQSLVSFLSTVLSLGEGLQIVSATAQHNELQVGVVATMRCAPCPLCAQHAIRIHSQYTRRVADLPCASQRVYLVLHVRKFFCETPTCPRRIFAERLTPFLTPWARMTSRLMQAHQTIGLATCGKLGARLAGRLGMPVSWMTILRRILATPPPPAPPEFPVYTLGIDDFAWRRGRTYGTILLDLDRRQVIDLLPDRTAATAAVWLRRYPQVALISRDRGGDYAAAARKAAPHALQIADRFHLMQNLTQAVGQVLVRCRAALQRNRQHLLAPHLEVPVAGEASLLHETRRSQRSQAQRENHQHRGYVCAEEYAQMRRWRTQGMSCREIARRLGKSTATVCSWLQRGAAPLRIHQRPRASQFDKYTPYVLARWKDGCHNGLQLWRELKERGYGGSPHMLYDFLAALRGPRGAARAEILAQVRDQWPSAKEAVWLLVRDPATLEDSERRKLTTLCQRSATAEILYPLVQEFRQMLHQRRGDLLDAWLTKAKATRLRELQRFVRGIEKDKAAVVAGLTRCESNGQTEGQIAKLKLIKRTMYGRAGFLLLRQRLLHAL